MKTIATTIRISLITGLLILIGIQTLKAQNQPTKKLFAFNKTEAITVNEFIFIKFLVSENSENVIYVIQRSEDGKNFSDIYLKKGYLSPQNTPLLYCYKDLSPAASTYYYRIKRVDNSNEVAYSDVFQPQDLAKPMMAQDEPEIK
jgi:hypothetical protein